MRKFYRGCGAYVMLPALAIAGAASGFYLASEMWADAAYSLACSAGFLRMNLKIAAELRAQGATEGGHHPAPSPPAAGA